MNLSFVLVCIASGGGDNYLEFFSGLISCCSLMSAFTLLVLSSLFSFSSERAITETS